MDASPENSDLLYLGEVSGYRPTIDLEASAFRRVDVQKGLTLLAADLTLTGPLLIKSNTFKATCLSVVLDGSAEGRAAKIDAGFVPNEVWVSSTNDIVPTSKIVHPNRPVRTVELVVTEEWFETDGAHNADDPAFAAVRAAMHRPTAFKRRPLDARLRQIASSVLHPPGHGAVERLHLEARGLDLLIALAAEYDEDGNLRPESRLPAGSLERIWAVRERIDANPAEAGTLTELAAAYGMSASSLKQNFFVAFGMCPGSYINERRLLQGRTLIEQHGLSVSEAAYRVGYAHPANFSAAFRRKFGYPPSAAKR